MTFASQKITFSHQVVEQIRTYVGAHLAERGGILGANRKGIITHFVADTTAQVNGSAYSPDIKKMNKVIAHWKSKGIQFVGFVHSHPPKVISPSVGDALYAGRILKCFQSLNKLLLLIVQTVPNTGTFEMKCYTATRSKWSHQAHINPCLFQVKKAIVTPSALKPTPIQAQETHPYLARQEGAVDLELMARSRVVVIGAGGSASLIRNPE